MSEFISLQEFTSELLKDDEFRKEYARISPIFSVIKSLIKMRLQKGLTQKDVANRMGVKQPVVGRLERFNATDVKLSTLVRYAEALDCALDIGLRTADSQQSFEKQKPSQASVSQDYGIDTAVVDACFAEARHMLDDAKHEETNFPEDINESSMLLIHLRKEPGRNKSWIIDVQGQEFDTSFRHKHKAVEYCEQLQEKLGAKLIITDAQGNLEQSIPAPYQCALAAHGQQ